MITGVRSNLNGNRTVSRIKRASAGDRDEGVAENVKRAAAAAPLAPPPAAAKKVGTKRATVQAKRVAVQEVRVAPEPIPEWSEVRENAGWTGVPLEQEHQGRVTVKSPVQILRSRFLPEMASSAAIASAIRALGFKSPPHTGPNAASKDELFDRLSRIWAGENVDFKDINEHWTVKRNEMVNDANFEEANTPNISGGLKPVVIRLLADKTEEEIAAALFHCAITKECIELLRAASIEKMNRPLRQVVNNDLSLIHI